MNLHRLLQRAALLVACCTLLPIALAAPEHLSLLGRSHVEGYRLHLVEADWRWLREQGRLRLGASAPDYAPFEQTVNGQDFEGITADYVGLLSELLHMPIEVLRYDSRAEVIDALERGEVDLLGTANGFEAADAKLVLTQTYAQDSPTLVTRSDASAHLPPDLQGLRLAMLDHYLPAASVGAFYPRASLQLYPSTLSALGAVAFGQADVYLGDSTTPY